VTHQEVQELLAAYAIDAVDPDEADMLEAHLNECRSCQAEVAMHRETAAKLGNVGGTAPAPLWDRISAELSSTLPAPPMPANVVRLRSRRPLVLSLGAVFAVAATVVIALLSVSTLHLQHRVNALRSAVGRGGLEQAAAAAVLNPDHTLAHLTSTDGRLSAEVVAVPGGQAYLLDTNLPAITADRTYQLWGLTDGRAVSLGLLGAHPEVVAFRVEPATTTLMVTAEPQGGRSTPDTPILIQGAV
jgi:anti-sigma factor RsiW